MALERAMQLTKYLEKQVLKVDYKKLGERIRIARINKDMTQARLSKEIKCSSPYISQIEKGKRKLSIDTLVSIADVLDTPVDFLTHEYFESNEGLKARELLQIIKECNNEEATFVLDNIKELRLSYIEQK